MNTMEDLRREVASRLRNTLHGQTVPKKTRLPQMLGITPLDKVHDPNNEEGTLLDTDHHFWQDWHEPVRTQSQAIQNIHDAVESLKADGTFRTTENGDQLYCEVDELPEETNFFKLHTTCAECGSDLYVSPNLSQDSGYYDLKFSLDCPDCEFSGVYKSTLQRL